MNLQELKTNIDYTIEHLNGIELSQVSVLITLSESSIGARASSNVRFVGMGFDWEHGQFRIEPSKQLVSKGNAMNDIKNVQQFEFSGQKYWGCPKCISKVVKDDCYCRHCGQRLR